MAFKIIKNPTFTTTARIITPTDAEPLVQSVVVQFRYVEWADDETDSVFLTKVVRDMIDLTDEAGNTVLFEDVRETLFAMPNVRTGLTKAYFEAMAGAAAKN